MGRFEQRVEAQDFPSRIATIRESLEALPASIKDSVNSTYPDSLERLEVVLDHALSVVGASNELLVSDQTINQTVAQLEQLNSYILNLGQQQDLNYFPNIEAAVEALVGVLASWPASQDEGTSQAITNAAGSYRRSLGQQLVQIRADLEAAQAATTQLATELVKSKPQIDSQIAQAQQTLGQQITTIDTRLTELRTTIDTEKARVDQLVTTQQQQFSETQEARGKEHKDALTQFQTEATELKKTAARTTDELIKEIEKQKANAEELVGYIATTGTASAYGKEAEAQGAVANRLRLGSVIAALIASAIAVWAVAQETARTQSLASSLTKVLAAAALYGVAGYLANQSGRHRRREEIARNRELELIAFGPFVAELDPTQRQEARAALVEKLFGRDPGQGKETEPALTQDNISLLGRIIDLVTQSRK